MLIIADTGIGMDEATLARATEPFFTTKADNQGTGLGLSMMEGLIAQSFSATRLRSAVGKVPKSSFGYRGRLRRPSGPQTMPVSGSRLGAVRQSLSVMTMSKVLEFLCDVLAYFGDQAVRSLSGRSALAAIEADDLIRLLVVDYVMPEMNGAELIDQVRALRPDILILLVTGNADPDAVQDQIPGVPMLNKPFSPEQFAARVGDLLNRMRVDA